MSNVRTILWNNTMTPWRAPEDLGTARPDPSPSQQQWSAYSVHIHLHPSIDTSLSHTLAQQMLLKFELMSRRAALIRVKEWWMEGRRIATDRYRFRFQSPGIPLQHTYQRILLGQLHIRLWYRHLISERSILATPIIRISNQRSDYYYTYKCGLKDGRNLNCLSIRSPEQFDHHSKLHTDRGQCCDGLTTSGSGRDSQKNRNTH